MRIINTWNVEASAEKAWEALGERFGEIGEMLSGLQATRLDGKLGVGTARVCQTNGFGPFPPLEIEERLVKFDRARHTFSYIADEGLPPMFVSAQNTWSIKPIKTDFCEVTTEAVIRLKWWAKPLGLVLPTLMAKDFRIVGEELKYRIETGEAHPRKLQKTGKQIHASS